MTKPFLEWVFDIMFWICVAIAIGVFFGAMLIVFLVTIAIWFGA